MKVTPFKRFRRLMRGGDLPEEWSFRFMNGVSDAANLKPFGVLSTK